MENRIKELEGQVKSLGEKVDKIIKDNETLESKVNNQEVIINTLEEIIEDGLNTTDSVSTAPKTVAKLEIPNETFKVGKESYRFRVAAFFDGTVKVTAENALKDKVLLARIVKSSPSLVEVV